MQDEKRHLKKNYFHLENNILGTLIFLTLLGEGQKNHGQLFFAYFAVPVEVTPFHDGVFKVFQVRCIVITLDKLQQIFEKASQLLVFDSSIAVL